MFGTYEEPARVLDRFCLSEVLSSFYNRSQINGRRYLDYSPDKTPFVQTRIRYDRNFASRPVEEAGKRVRTTDAGISYASGYNSEIPKSMDIYIAEATKQKKRKKKTEREEANELQSIWDGIP